MRNRTIAEAYRAQRAKHPRQAAKQAFLIAKSESADYRFWRAIVEADDEFHGEGSARESFARYQLDNGRTLRVEFEYMNDDSDSDWETEPQELSELVEFYRKSKYGKAAAWQAARETRAAQEQEHAKKERGDYYTCGVIVRVYWRGEEVANESLWSIIHETEDDTYSTVREVLAEALAKARDKIRAEGRKVHAMAAEFGYQPIYNGVSHV